MFAFDDSSFCLSFIGFFLSYVLRRNSWIRKGNWVQRIQTNAAKCKERKKETTTEVGNLGPETEEREEYETRFLFCSISFLLHPKGRWM
jgi:hypothetical protein